MIIGAALRLSHLDVERRAPDEKVYAYQAKTIADHGIRGVDLLARQYLAEPGLWILPPPTRLGHTVLAAWAMRLTGIEDERLGSALSAAFSIATLCLLLHFGMRFFRPGIAIAALALLSVSPMDMTIARRAYQDSVLAFFSLLTIYGACEAAADRKNLGWPLLVFLSGGYCLLIKESGGVIFGLCALGMTFDVLAKEGVRWRSLIPAGLFLAGLVGAAALQAHAVGGIDVLLSIWKHEREAMAANPYALKYMSGSGFLLPASLWKLSPLGAMLSLIGLVSTLVPGTIRRRGWSEPRQLAAAAQGMAFFTVGLLGVTMAIPNCLNLRYISAAYAPLCLLAGVGLWRVAAWIGWRPGGRRSWFVLGAAAVVLAAAAILDYGVFHRVFIDLGVPDLPVRVILKYV